MCRWEAGLRWPHVSRGFGLFHALSAELELSLPGACTVCLPASAIPLSFTAPLRPCVVLQSLGDVFSSLSAAVGAADKVVEMIKRVPQIPSQGSLSPSEFCGRVELQSVGASWSFVFARPLSLLRRCQIAGLKAQNFRTRRGQRCACSMASPSRSTQER